MRKSTGKKEPPAKVLHGVADVDFFAKRALESGAVSLEELAVIAVDPDSQVGASWIEGQGATRPKEAKTFIAAVRREHLLGIISVAHRRFGVAIVGPTFDEIRGELIPILFLRARAARRQRAPFLPSGRARRRVGEHWA
jgi:hypothetical protein